MVKDMDLQSDDLCPAPSLQLDHEKNHLNKLALYFSYKK